MVLAPSFTPWSFISLRPCETQLSVFIATASAGTRWVCPPSVFTKSYLPLPDRGARYLFYGQEFTALGHRVLVALKEKWTLLIFCGKFRLPYLSKATAVPRAELPCLTGEHGVVAFNFLLYNGDYLLILPKQLEKKTFLTFFNFHVPRTGVFNNPNQRWWLQHAFHPQTRWSVRYFLPG